MTKKGLAVVIFSTFLQAGCATMESLLAKPDTAEAETFPTPVLTVKPELDYTGEYPDCLTAGQRLSDNVEVGMTLKEVTRLVGQPRWKMPGSWWWSQSFSKEGKPLVRFDFEQGQDDSVVKSIKTDTSRCEPVES